MALMRQLSNYGDPLGPRALSAPPRRLDNIPPGTPVLACTLRGAEYYSLVSAVAADGTLLVGHGAVPVGRLTRSATRTLRGEDAARRQEA